MRDYRVEWDGCHFQADLCKEHAGPLMDFIESFPDHFTVRLPEGARKGIVIHTMDEIENLKNKRR